MHRCLFLILAPASLFAQGSSVGNLTGVVTDPSGSAIPGASVVARNTATNQSRETRTTGSGLYSITSLPIGNYDLRVGAAGFQTVEVKDLKLDVNGTLRIDVPMTVGQVTETVQVEAQSPLLNTENASTGQIIEAKRITELPLNGRDFQQLQLLTPGNISGTNFQTGQGLSGGASSLTTTATMNVANGGRPGQLLFTIDGSNASNQNGRGIILTPSIDEIQEFKTESSNMSAEFGYGSSTVNVSIKSGTNELHGAAWEFLRNDKVDARPFFATRKPPLRRNQFGANAGGPVHIPGLYNGRDRTFWFFNYEGQRLRQGASFAPSVPTARMRTGDLSELPSAIFDPGTTVADPNRPNGFLRQPFAGNIVPGARIDSIARFFLQPEWIPLPIQPGIAANLRREFSVPSHYNQETVKIDHRIRAADSISGRLSLKRAVEGSYGNYHGLNPYDPGANPKRPRGYNSVLNWTHLFGPTKLLEARASYSRAKVLFDTPNFGSTDFTTQLGIQGFGPGVSDVYPSYPVMNITGFTGLPQGFLLNYTSNNFEYTANFTMVRGRHTFKMGETYRSWQQNLTTSGQGSGTFVHTGVYSNNPANLANTGAGLADFLLGIPFSASRYVPPGWYYQRLRNNWAYFTDDWKASSRLTLNLGLRYELNVPTTEKRQQFASFLPSARNGRGAILVPNEKSVSPPYLQSSVARSWSFYRQFAVFATDAGISDKHLRVTGHYSWAPRAGLTYRLNNNTVVRAGYGIFWVQLDGNRESEFESVPFLIRESGILNDSFIPTRNTRNFLPAGSSFSQFATLLAHDPWARDFGYSQQWNFAIQRQLPGQFSIDTAYVGTKGTRLQSSRGLNVPREGAGAVQARRPFPDFGVITWNEQSASSIYHSLQVKLERRFSKGLSLLTAFTWSKSIDRDSTNGEGLYDPYDARRNRGVSLFDLPRVFTTGLVWETRWLRSGSGPRRFLLGGWTLGSVITIQDGFPFTPGFAGDPSNTGTGSRADVVSGCDIRAGGGTPQRWFNTSCFAAPPGAPVYRRGNVGRNILRGDGYQNVDLSLYKDFLLKDQRKVQIRFEGFNAFNLHTFTFPNATVNDPNFGRVFGSSPARVMQVAAKFVF